MSYKYTTYCGKRLEEVGLKFEDVTIQSRNQEGGPLQIVQFAPAGLSDEDIRITYVDLNGEPMYTGAKQSKIYAVTRINPSKVDGGKKYDNPNKDKTRLFITPGVLKAYRDKSEINRLYVVEGQIKAATLDKYGARAVGISGIHNIKDRDTGDLYPELIKIVENLRVKNVILLFDADVYKIEYNKELPERDLARRLTSFASAVKNFRRLCKHKAFNSTDVYFSHLHERWLLQDIKAIDDLIAYSLTEQNVSKDTLNPATIIDDLDTFYKISKGRETDEEQEAEATNPNKQKYFRTRDITRSADWQIEGLFGLGKLEWFLERHSQFVKENLYGQVFTYRGSQYQLDNRGALLDSTDLSRIFPFVSALRDKNGHVIDWEISDIKFIEYLRDKFSIYQSPIKRDDNYYRIVSKIIYQRLREELKPELTGFFRKYEKLANKIIRGGYLESKRLEYLPKYEGGFLRDNKDNCYLFLRSGYLNITKDGYEIKPYKDLPEPIFESYMGQNDFDPETKADPNFSFRKFFRNVCSPRNFDIEPGKEYPPEILAREKALKTAVGYLLHTHKEYSKAKAIFLVDEYSRPGKAMGRTGKGIFTLMLKALRPNPTTMSIDGKSFLDEDRFVLQNVTYATRIFTLNDAKPDFNFERLFNVVTGDMDIERKGRARFSIPFNLSPKILIDTNYLPFGKKGDSFKGRMNVYPFSNYYHIGHTPRDETEKDFFTEWGPDEWNQFYLFAIECIQTYLEEGLLQTPETEEFATSKLLQQSNEAFVDYAYTYLYSPGLYPKEDLRKHFYEYADTDKESYKGPPPDKFFKKWLQAWADHKGWDFDTRAGIPRRINGSPRQIRCYGFIDPGDEVASGQRHDSLALDGILMLAPAIPVTDENGAGQAENPEAVAETPVSENSQHKPSTEPEKKGTNVLDFLTDEEDLPF